MNDNFSYIHIMRGAAICSDPRFGCETLECGEEKEEEENKKKARKCIGRCGNMKVNLFKFRVSVQFCTTTVVFACSRSTQRSNPSLVEHAGGSV